VLLIIFLTIGSGILIAVVALSIQSNNRKAIDAGIAALPGFSAAFKVMSEDGSTGIAIDQDAKKVCLSSKKGTTLEHKVVGYRDLLEVEIMEDGHSITKTSRSSQAGNAILGGILLGGVGAVVGALTSSTKTTGKIRRVDLKIVVNDVKSPVFLINFMNVQANAGGIIHQAASKKAMEWLGRLKVLITMADNEDKAAHTPIRVTSNADELLKLADLRDRGILTEQEFQQQKAQVLQTLPVSTANP
jgi:hypothetical protein